MFIVKHRALLISRYVSGHNHNWSRLLPGLLAAVLLSSPVAGQSVTGTISGTVIDPNGAVVAGANVSLLNKQTNDRRDQATNESGRFTFASVQPGVYDLKIEHAGFETLLRTRVVLSANEGLALGEIAMKTGQVTETVTVTSEGQLVEKQSSDLQARLTGDQISLNLDERTRHYFAVAPHTRNLEQR